MQHPPLPSPLSSPPPVHSVDTLRSLPVQHSITLGKHGMKEYVLSFREPQPSPHAASPSHTLSPTQLTHTNDQIDSPLRFSLSASFAHLSVDASAAAALPETAAVSPSPPGTPSPRSAALQLLTQQRKEKREKEKKHKKRSKEKEGGEERSRDKDRDRDREKEKDRKRSHRSHPRVSVPSPTRSLSHSSSRSTSYPTAPFPEPLTIDVESGVELSSPAGVHSGSYSSRRPLHRSSASFDSNSYHSDGMMSPPTGVTAEALKKLKKKAKEEGIKVVKICRVAGCDEQRIGGEKYCRAHSGSAPINPNARKMMFAH